MQLEVGTAPLPGGMRGAELHERKPWLALITVCLGVLMIVLDGTVVNVALPTIQKNLGFTEASLVWVVNAYMLAFGGSLLIGGRLGDFYGHRRVFLIGIMVFTVASVACGLSATRIMLVSARAVQGIGGAVVVAVALSLITSMFPSDAGRAKAIGIYGFVCAGGGCSGLLLGGALTSALNWHWIFLINLPVGISVYMLCKLLLPADESSTRHGSIDVWGAITVTASLVLAIYAIVGSSEVGWDSDRTIWLLLASALLLAVFGVIEAFIPTPLVPPRVIRLRSLYVASIVTVLWSAGGSAWFFTAALYLQFVLGFDPAEVGLAFLPGNIATAVFALGLSARVVRRFGIKRPLGVGLLLAALGLAWLARAPVEADVFVDVIPAMILIGSGSGVAYNPLLLAATRDVAESEYGLASGIFTVASLLGGALGLAILAGVSAMRTHELVSGGADRMIALNGGYHLAFQLSAIFTVAAACVCGALRSVRSEGNP